MVSQNYRFKRAPQTIKGFLCRNIIGNIGSVFINFQKAPYFTGFRIEIDEPLITDMAIHQFDQILNILGREPVSVAVREPPAVFHAKEQGIHSCPSGVCLQECGNRSAVQPLLSREFVCSR